jgi:hypothetical protein
MFQQGCHLARVRARTVAVLSLADVLEELIGEVHDAIERSRRY